MSKETEIPCYDEVNEIHQSLLEDSFTDFSDSIELFLKEEKTEKLHLSAFIIVGPYLAIMCFYDTL